jgi:hypothetical protein
MLIRLGGFSKVVGIGFAENASEMALECYESLYEISGTNRVVYECPYRYVGAALRFSGALNLDSSLSRGDRVSGYELPYGVSQDASGNIQIGYSTYDVANDRAHAVLSNLDGRVVATSSFNGIEYDPESLSDRTVKRVYSPYGPTIFAKSLTGLTSVDTKTGLVTVLKTEEELIALYSPLATWERELKESTRLWAHHPAWDSAADSVSTAAEFSATYGLTMTPAEWGNRVSLASQTPEQRETWRLANPPTTKPASTPQNTEKYSVTETVILLDADYWYPAKISFQLHN